MTSRLWLVGCGRVFESIAAGEAAYQGAAGLGICRLESTDAIAGADLADLAGREGDDRVFVAVDQSALNYARFDLYGRLRLAGYRFRTLVHETAIVDPSAQIGENCWVGPGAIVASRAVIGNNTFVGAGAMVDAAAQLASNVWVGSGARVGADSRVGNHSVVGADVRVGNAIEVGRHCSIETPGHYVESLADRTFIDPLFELPVRIYAAGARGAR